jgi:hypothetical protein
MIKIFFIAILQADFMIERAPKNMQPDKIAELHAV